MNQAQVALKPNEPANSEVIRIIQQYLSDQGLKDISLMISKRTGISQEDDAIRGFRQAILMGKFNQIFIRKRDPYSGSQLAKEGKGGKVKPMGGKMAKK
jgi:hypothetical protein